MKAILPFVPRISPRSRSIPAGLGHGTATGGDRSQIGPALLCILIGLAGALLSATAVATDYPLTVTDDLGREVTIDSAPKRVVSMIASSTEIACALHACDLLVGVDEFSNHPAEVNELPRLGSAFSPNLEELVSLEPDLVLADEYSGIVEVLDSLDIPVYAGTGQSLDEVLDSFSALGLLLDRETEAALLRGRMEGELAAVAQRVSELEAPTVYFEVDATPYTVGPGSFVDELISLAGGENVIGEGFGEFPQVDPEYVVGADPDVIVLADAPFGESARSLAERPGWDTISAVARGRVIELSSEQVDALNRPGPRAGEAVRLLARIFHPDEF